MLPAIQLTAEEAREVLNRIGRDALAKRITPGRHPLVSAWDKLQDALNYRPEPAPAVNDDIELIEGLHLLDLDS